MCGLLTPATGELSHVAMNTPRIMTNVYVTRHLQPSGVAQRHERLFHASCWQQGQRAGAIQFPSQR